MAVIDPFFAESPAIAATNHDYSKKEKSGKEKEVAFHFFFTSHAAAANRQDSCY
jgi:hypothetical protein